jgi:hypothetical protein
MKKIFGFLFIVLAAGVWADAEVTIQRADSKINAGFRERVFIDGKQVLNLANGASGTVKVSSGEHVIHAQLYTLTTSKLSFSAGSGAIKFVITPYALDNFVVEQTGGAPPPPVAAPPPPVAVPSQPAAAPARPATHPNSVEGSLERAADRIMEKISKGSKVAIVYVTAEDPMISEFIAGELEFFMVDHGLTVIDRSQLDRIREEQKLQTSGEVDDNQAVLIGKISGASIIVTGAVTGTGELRRLRLRALDTQTAQVLSVASEKY